MFWIHGGGFVSGAGDDDVYGPKFLVRQDVILVTFNYRLEVLGFLCLDTEDVPGNAGMKDQVAALRWVNKNIASFGGDPNNVTIFGESAGGASVTYHLISPMSKGLFRRAIAQSGTNVGYWAQAYKPRERGFALARKLGYNSDDPKQVYKFLKEQPLESLIKATVPITYSEKVRTYTEFYFSVAAEKQFGNNERFFCGDVLDSVSTGIHEGVDIMTGYTADEGILSLAIFGDISASLEQARNFPQFFISYPMSLTLSTNDQLELGKRIREYYFKNSISVPDDWEKLEKFYAADLFVFPANRWIKLCAQSKKNKAYFYKFTCVSELNTISQMIGVGDLIKDKPVVGHADDLLYLFTPNTSPIIDRDSKTFQHVEKVTKLWTNFAKFGNPTPDDSLGVTWTPYSVANKDYLDIGNELKPGQAPDDEEVQFWENVLTEFKQKLY
ncbi:cholinesterase 2-like [Spodoptera litura]|uniref:Carboxylic ester hydrolase n=1 Tax=Spodoptera litura TaxID=69820 RepID=A0A9J7J518_SPOLT|nr:cholinesterase 2-like [Spodoptera litura]